MSTPVTKGPHDVPNLRLYLLDRWRVGGVLEHTAKIVWDARKATNPYGWRPREEAEWHRIHLGDPDLALWWVSGEMVDEISHVAAELPDDVRPVDVPGLVADEVSMRGLVILEKSVVGLDAEHAEHQILVDGFMYGGTHLPPVHGRPWRHATSVATYRRVDYDAGLDGDGIEAAGPALMAERELTGALSRGEVRQEEADKEWVHMHGEEWLPLGRSDWPFIDRLCDKVDQTISDQGHASMSEDRRWLAALHLVAEDHRVAMVKRVEPAEKRLRRPSERRKLGTAVRVLYLRVPEQLDEETTVVAGRGSSGRKAPRAHLVRSHPRWQACGPGRQDHKLILIPRHTRGVGAPVEGPPTVRAVVREKKRQE